MLYCMIYKTILKNTNFEIQVFFFHWHSLVFQWYDVRNLKCYNILLLGCKKGFSHNRILRKMQKQSGITLAIKRQKSYVLAELGAFSCRPFAWRVPAFFHFLFAFRVPACFFKAFFSRTKIRVPAFSRSKFSFAFLFRALQLKNISRSPLPAPIKLSSRLMPRREV